MKRRLELNDRDGIRTNKNFNSLVVEKWGMSILLLKRNIVGIILERQESFDLVKEVLKHFVIILVECKSRIMGSIMQWMRMMLLGFEMCFGSMQKVG